MPFDITKFDQTQFNERTKDIDVPELKSFFPEGEPAVWKVRGLTGEEIARTREAVERNRVARAEIISAQERGASEAVAMAMKTLLGVASLESVPDDHVRHLNTVVMGSLSPKVKLEHAVKLATTFPIVFTQLHNEIYILTGLGHEQKKQ